MDYNEFQEKDLELLGQIDDLRTDSLDLQQQMIANEKEIIRLEHERSELRAKYYTTSDAMQEVFTYKKQERGLCGNVIEKGNE